MKCAKKKETIKKQKKKCTKKESDKEKVQKHRKMREIN